MGGIGVVSINSIDFLVVLCYNVVSKSREVAERDLAD